MFFWSIALLAAQAESTDARAECRVDEQSILELSFAEFDQTEGSGWRPLYRAGCYAEAAELLAAWKEVNGDGRVSIIPLHEAQMRAYAGQSEAALKLFGQLHSGDGSVSAVTANLYVDGNIAFLRRDRGGLEAAVAALANVPKPAGWDNAVGVDGEPLTMPWPVNLPVLEAMLRCWDETYEVAAHCHIEGWHSPRAGD